MIWYIILLTVLIIPVPRNEHFSQRFKYINFTCTHLRTPVSFRISSFLNSCICLLHQRINGILHKYGYIRLAQSIQVKLENFECDKCRLIDNQYCLNNKAQEKCKMYDRPGVFDLYKKTVSHFDSKVTATVLDKCTTVNSKHGQTCDNEYRKLHDIKKISKLDLNLNINPFRKWKDLQISRYIKEHFYHQNSASMANNNNNNNTDILEAGYFEATLTNNDNTKIKTPECLSACVGNHKSTTNSELGTSANGGKCNMHLSRLTANNDILDFNISPEISSLLSSDQQRKTTVKKSIPRHRKNYANSNCGAKIIATNRQSQNAKEILSENRDGYMLNPCKVNIWFIIELCERIHVESVEVASFELFARVPKKFHLSATEEFDPSINSGDPDNDNNLDDDDDDDDQHASIWYDLGIFTFSSINREVNRFNVSMKWKGGSKNTIDDITEFENSVDDSFKHKNTDTCKMMMDSAQQVGQCEEHDSPSSSTSAEFDNPPNSNINFYKSIHDTVYEQPYVKYIRFEMLEYEGTEHYCPLSLVRVYGSTLEEVINFHEQSKNSLIDAIKSSMPHSSSYMKTVQHDKDSSQNHRLENDSVVKALKIEYNSHKQIKLLPISQFLLYVIENNRSYRYLSDLSCCCRQIDYNSYANDTMQWAKCSNLNYLNRPHGLRALHLWILHKDRLIIKHIINNGTVDYLNYNNTTDNHSNTTSNSGENNTNHLCNISLPMSDHYQHDKQNTNYSLQNEECHHLNKTNQLRAEGSEILPVSRDNTTGDKYPSSTFSTNNSSSKMQNKNRDRTEVINNDTNASTTQTCCNGNSLKSTTQPPKLSHFNHQSQSQSNQPLLVRYGNRLNMLELNVSLHSSYLDQISFDYNEHMKKIIDTIETLREDLNRQDIQDEYLIKVVKIHTKRLLKIEGRIRQIESRIYGQQAKQTKSIIFIYLVIFFSVVIVLLISVSYYCELLGIMLTSRVNAVTQIKNTCGICKCNKQHTNAIQSNIPKMVQYETNSPGTILCFTNISRTSEHCITACRRKYGGNRRVKYTYRLPYLKRRRIRIQRRYCNDCSDMSKFTDDRDINLKQPFSSVNIKTSTELLTSSADQLPQQLNEENTLSMDKANLSSNPTVADERMCQQRLQKLDSRPKVLFRY